MIINEFGEIGIDQDLIVQSSGDMVLLQSGCLCCTIRDDLVDSLRSMLMREAFVKQVGGIESAGLDRILIETTGLADPIPIIETLTTDRIAVQYCSLDSVITTVDALAFEDTILRHREAAHQIGLADRILITKTDLTSPGDIEGLHTNLRRLNPAAQILETTNGAVNPDWIFDIYNHEARIHLPELRQAYIARHQKTDSHHHEHHHDVNRHDKHVQAYCFNVDTPLKQSIFCTWQKNLSERFGKNLLRLKGIINIEETGLPMAIHAVQGRIFPSTPLPSWPSDDHRGRIVIILRDAADADITTIISQLK